MATTEFANGRRFPIPTGIAASAIVTTVPNAVFGLYSARLYR